MTYAVDQVARDMANKAIAMIEAHEDVCEIRNEEAKTWRKSITDRIDTYFLNINGQLGNVSDSIRNLYGRMWIAAFGVIGMLLTVCGYLIHNHGL
jgi:hypothetical protein